MIRCLVILSAVFAIAGAPAAAIAGTQDEGSPSPSIWGGEVRLHAGSLNGAEGLGRTGGLFETRVSLETALAAGLSVYGEIGSGFEQGPDESGLHQLYLNYQFTEQRDVTVRAGWIPLPFGRWNAMTLSRPLIKDQEFRVGSSQEFILRRASAGLSFHAGSGHLETDLAVLDQSRAEEFRIEREGGADAVGRFGFRSGGFSAGVSLLQGLRGGDAPSGTPGAQLGGVRARGIDLQWSRGLLSLGGEALVLDIDEHRNAGYYVQGALDISRLVRGLRLIVRHDFLDETAGELGGRFRRETIGLRQALRRDLDVELEFNRDHGDRNLPAFGGSHFVFGLRYRF